MQFNLKFISIVTAALLTTTTFVGCNEDTATSTSTSVTGGISNTVSTPTGTVTGLVQDTNGNPIEGATVYVAGQTTNTDAGGIYTFKDVPVTQTFDIEVTSAELANQLSVTIVPPSGYIGATVTVRPAAQISSAEGTATNGVETFIDGYIASAGTAVIPDLNSSVTGVLRDTNTGEPIANSTVSFEFISTSTGVAQEQTQDGLTTSYAVSTYSVTTGSDGAFTYPSLPSDSIFTIQVPGYAVTSAANFSTTDEPSHTLGNVTVTKITATDTLPPYIMSVDNVISAATASPAILDDDTRDTFVVNFSETLDPAKLELAGNSILVYAGKTGNEMKISFTASIDSANKTITIATTSVFNDGDSVHILFLKSDLQDTSGNSLIDGPIAYDGNFGTSSTYVRVELEIFKEANTEAPAVTVADQLDKDTLGEDDDALVQAKSDAFKDVLDGTAKFQQLNSADDDDNAAGTDSQERLDTLVQALGGAGVENDKTRLSFTPSGAYAYMVTVTDKSGAAKAQSDIFIIPDAITSNVDTANSADFGGTATAFLITTDVNPVEVYLSNVAPTDIVTITPTDSLGYMGTAKSITLIDNVAPTTVLQKSYYAGTATSGTSSTVVTVNYGDGGELSDAQNSVTVGTPYLAITNSLLDNQDANGVNAIPDKKLQTELYDLSVVNDATQATYLSAENTTLATYDAQAFVAFNTDVALARKMGVAFSEDVNLTGTPTFNGTNAVVDNFVVQNDVTKNVYTSVVNVDLIDMDVSNVMTLANLDDLALIDYTDVIKDNSGNIATSTTNAKVVVKDEMAPMAIQALYKDTSAQLVITFNEAIALEDGVSEIGLEQTAGIFTTATYNATATQNQWTLDATGTVLTLPFGAFSTPINNETFWTTAPAPAYAYPNDNYAIGATTPIDHALMDTSTIKDTKGNSWVTYTTNTGIINAVQTPTFAAAQETTGFITSSANATFSGATDTTATLTTVSWSFTQPVDNTQGMFAGVVVDNSGVYTLTNEATITGYFDFAGTSATSFISGTTLSLSADKKTITLAFLTDADMVAGDTLVNATVITSEGDTDQSITTGDTSNPIVTAQ